MANAPAQMTPAQQAQAARNNNRSARQSIIQSSIEMKQLITTASFTPSAGVPNVYNFTPRNVGLLRRFFVECIVTGTTASGATLTRAPFGSSNILSNVTFNDFQNNSRVNTTGWHLSVVNSFKSKASAPIGSAEVTDTVLGFGNVYSPIVCPATVAASTAWTATMVYEIPVAYSDQDLRGAIYMATTGATAQLQLTFNPLFAVVSTSDYTGSVFYWTGSAPTITNVTYNIYQDYLDQLPTNPQTGRVVLPVQDLNAVYQLLNTNISGLAVNQPFGVPYTNLRTYLSTTVVYDNGGTLYAGTDVTNVGLQAANSVFLWQLSPRLTAYLTRKMINADVPIGTYFFDHRHSPISTYQFGNMQFVLTPSLVNANAQLLIGYEFMVTRDSIRKAASLPIG